MPGLLQYPIFQAFDDDGDPLSGGKLYTYVAGTTTDKATYSDRALVSANANPVVLDSRGEAVIHFAGRIKLVLKTSADVTIWTRDNVEGVMQSKNTRFVDANETDQGAAGDGNSLKDLIDDIGASLEATLVFKHDVGSGNTTVFTVSTDETILSNIKVRVEKGVRIDIDTGVTLTIEGEIEAGAYQIFSGLGTVVYTASNGIWHNEWESGGSGTKIPDTLELASGTTINEISVDDTLAGNSDDAAPTEKAVKTYIDAVSPPIGSIVALAYNAGTIPTGWLECDGSTVSRNTYASLFAAIADLYGVGDGVATFEIPDLRGQFLRGFDNGAAIDPDAASRTDAGDGATTGDNVGTKQTDEYESHTHATTVPRGTTIGAGANATGAITYSAHSITASVAAMGGNESRPVNVSAMYLIKY